MAKATFAGGCFWCMEEAFDKVPGVVATTSGYMGGQTKNPTYEQVSTGRTGHAEVVQVEYDPAKVTYEKLLDAFWRNIDPTQKDAQFCDHGSQYRSAIFYHNEEQRRLAESSRTTTRGQQAVQGGDRDAAREGGRFLPCRGVSPGLLPEEPGALQVLQERAAGARRGCGSSGEAARNRSSGLLLFPGGRNGRFALRLDIGLLHDQLPVCGARPALSLT